MQNKLKLKSFCAVTVAILSFVLLEGPLFGTLSRWFCATRRCIVWNTWVCFVLLEVTLFGTLHSFFAVRRNIVWKMS